MDAWRYGIYLLVFTFNISLVRCAHSFDIDVNTKINAISQRDHVLFSIYFQYHTKVWSKEFHLNCNITRFHVQILS